MLEQGGSYRNPLYFISWLTDFGGMLIVFTVSRDLAESGASLLTMGVVGAAVSLCQAASSIVCGRVSDRIGRPLLVFCGTLLLLLAALGCLLLTPYSIPYFAAYAATGLSLGMVFAPLIAWLNPQIGGADSRSVSFPLIRFCIAWNLGVVSGQLAGGWLFTFGRMVPLATAAGLAIANTALVLPARRRSMRVMRGIPRSGPEAGSSPADFSSALLFARLNWIANFGSAFTFSMVLHLFPKLAVNLGIPPAQHGVILGLMRVIVIAIYLLLYQTRFWHFRLRYPLAAQTAAAAGLAVLYFARDAYALTAGLMGIGVLTSYNYFAGIYYSSVASRDSQRGRSTGIHEGTLGLGVAAGSVCGGLIGTYAGARAPYPLALAVILVLMAIQSAIYLRGPAG
jgi:MFS family permease